MPHVDKMTTVDGTLIELRVLDDETIVLVVDRFSFVTLSPSDVERLESFLRVAALSVR